MRVELRSACGSFLVMSPRKITCSLFHLTYEYGKFRVYFFRLVFRFLCCPFSVTGSLFWRRWTRGLRRSGRLGAEKALLVLIVVGEGEGRVRGSATGWWWLHRRRTTLTARLARSSPRRRSRPKRPDTNTLTRSAPHPTSWGLTCSHTTVQQL